MAQEKKPLVFRDRDTKEKIPFYVKTEDVQLPDGTDIETKIDELEEEIGHAGSGTVKSVTLNGTTAEPDENGDVELELEVPEQVQADWEEDDSSDPAYIKHKPTVDDVLDEDSENAIANKTVTAAIAGLRQAIETVLGEGSTTAIENFQEVLDFLAGVTDEKTLIGLLNTMNTAIGGKLDKTDVYNGLDRTTEGKALDARQGKALNDLITALQSGKSDKNATVSGVTYDTTSHKLKQTINGTTSDVANVDTAPTANSDNFVTSGGVSTALATLLSNIHIGTNGNWWVGPETDPNNDTGIKAQGPKGNSVVNGDTFDIVNNLTDGGEADALSAEMGKTLRAAILTIYNALGAYAFPEGKPTLNWNSGVVKHSITATLTNLTPSETIPAEVTDNDGLEITLNLPSNLYVIDDDNLVITMGGQNIKSTAYDESTGKITIEHVTGAVVIEAAAITYVQDGLVLHLDCKHRGGVGSEVSGHWKSLVNYNGSPLDFTLGSGVTAADTGMVFDGGANSYGETEDSLDVAADNATIEGVFNGASQEYNPVLINPTANMIGLILYNYNSNKKISTIWMSRQGNSTTVNNSSLAVGTTAASVTDFAMSQNVSRFMNKGVSSTPSEHDAFLMNALHTKLTIGRARRSGDFAFTGTIKAIRVYSAVLTEAQQLQNWKVDKKRFNIS